MIIHDLICNRCQLICLDIPVDSTRLDDHLHPYECTCGGVMEVYYGNWSKDLEPNTHPSERVIIYKSDKEGGRIQYPGRSDVPIPERLKKRGYERVELNVRDLSRFEKHHNVANERRHFDRNGRGF